MNIRNKYIQQLLPLALAFSLFMLTVTTGQFVICVTNGHIAIELNGISDCGQACENPVAEQERGSTSCSHCTDTAVILKEILKDKDQVNVCSKCIISNVQFYKITDQKTSNLFSYLYNYKNFSQSYDRYNIDTNILLI